MQYESSMGPLRRFVVFLGFPVTETRPVLSGFAWITWLLVLTLTTIHFYEYLIIIPDLSETTDAQYELLLQPLEWSETLSFNSEQPGRMHGFTLLSHALIHFDAFHLFGNLYFLLLFGPAVEKHLGIVRYSLLLLTGVLASVGVFILFHPENLVTLIGASGGISAIVAFYSFEFVEARIGFFPPVASWIAFFWVPCFPAWALIFIWTLKEILFAFIFPHSGIAYEAHFGGAAMGFGFWLIACWGEEVQSNS